MARTCAPLEGFFILVQTPVIEEVSVLPAAMPQWVNRLFVAP